MLVHELIDLLSRTSPDSQVFIDGFIPSHVKTIENADKKVFILKGPDHNGGAYDQFANEDDAVKQKAFGILPQL
jgi:hypothetical protein